MSGDRIDIAVKDYYNTGTTSTPGSSLTDVLASLATGIVGASGGAKGSVADLNNTSTSPVYAALNSFLTGNDPNPSGKPKAYLNWILLDEQLKYVSSYPQSGAIAVRSAGVLDSLIITGIPVTKSGYLYIWVSNETPNWDVFFDNLRVVHYSGPLLEETHYYPFGLTIAALSSKALKPYYAENRYKFNGGNELQSKEFSDGSGLEWYDAVHRIYDPQIGRFGQTDPYADVFSGESPYSFANNDPTLLNDPFGLLSDSAHPQELAPVVATPQKKSSTTVIIDSRPSKRNPNFRFGTNTPFYVHYNQTDPGQWNPQITAEFATSLKISATLIPAGKGLKLAYEAYKLLQRLRSLKNIPEATKKADKNASPDYPQDPTKPPAEGWVWRGQSGSTPGSRQGSWYNPSTRESLHPDLNHPDPVGPHWDYKSPEGQTYRLFPDGRIEPK
jgi:RHS repeat-associated protein